jgi:hypothetical protein
MLVKLGNRIYDSKKDIIGLVLSEEESTFIRSMNKRDNMVVVCPAGTDKEVIDKFNGSLVKKIRSELCEKI